MHWNTSNYIQQEFQPKLPRYISTASRNKSFDSEQGLEQFIVFLKLESIVFWFKINWTLELLAPKILSDRFSSSQQFIIYSKTILKLNFERLLVVNFCFKDFSEKKAYTRNFSKKYQNMMWFSLKSRIILSANFAKKCLP